MLAIMRIHAHIHTHAACVAVVEHRPLIRTLQRQTDDAVFHPIVIPVCLYIDERLAEGDSHIHLLGVFWFQITIAHHRIIEVVEGWCPEHGFVERAKGPVAQRIGSQRIPRHLMQRLCLTLRMVSHIRIKSTHTHLQSSVLIESRERSLTVQAIDVVEILHIGSEVTPSQITGSREAEIMNQIRCCQCCIHILLMISVVGMYRYILRIIRTVMKEIIGIFQYRPDAYQMLIFR